MSLLLRPKKLTTRSKVAEYDLSQVSGQNVPDKGSPYYWVLEDGVWIKRTRRGVNLLSANQASGGENGNTVGVGINFSGATVTSSTEKPRTGTRSFKVVCDGTSVGQGMVTSNKTVVAIQGQIVTCSAYVAGLTGGEEAFLYLNENDIDGNWLRGFVSPLTTLGTDFQRLSISEEIGTNTTFVTFVVRGKNSTAMTFYVDDMQLEYSELTDWELPPLNGLLGSGAGTDTNNPTPTGTGLSFDSNDYVSLPSLPPMYGFDIVFTLASAVTSLSTALGLLGIGSYTGINFGSSTANLTNEIIAIINAQIDDGIPSARLGWCSTVDNISAGTHLLQLNFNGAWSLQLNRVTLPLIANIDSGGYQRPLPSGAIKLGATGVGSSSFNTHQIHHFIPHTEPRTLIEIATDAKVLRDWTKGKGLTPLW